MDKVKNGWVAEQTTPLDYAVETYQLSGTASLLTTPVPTEEQSAEKKDPDEHLQKENFVAKEIEKTERLNKLKDDTIQDLKQRNETQQRMIVALTTPQQRPQPQLLPQLQAQQQPPQTNARVDNNNSTTTQVEDTLYEKKDPWEVGVAVKKFAEYVRAEEAKGNVVHINDTNVINHNLVHNWGKLLREELGRADHQATKAKALQDVRLTNHSDIYNTPKDKVRRTLVSPRTGSSQDSSAYGGDINRVAQGNSGGGDNDGGAGGGSPGDPNGNDNNIVNRRWGGHDYGDDKKRREFLLAKSSNINITAFIGFNLEKNPYIPFNKAIRNLILAQGEDGEELLKVLDHIETYGDQKFTSANLRALAYIYIYIYISERL